MKYYLLILFALITIVTSCGKHDYINAIPANSTAIISANATDITEEQSPFASLLTMLFDNNVQYIKGIDVTKEIYLFAAGDGNIGVCAPIADNDDFNEFVTGLINLGILKNHKELDNKEFYTLKNQWVLGYDNSTLLIIGPVTGAEAESHLRRRMSRLMEKDDNESIKNSMLWQHLQEQKGDTRMVALASSLPEQIALAATLGAPKGTSADDVLLEAELTYKDGVLQLLGTTCSYNPNIKQALKETQALYRPITADWQKFTGDTTAIGIFVNVDGEKFIPCLQRNKALNTMLMGTDSYDIIRNSNGNIGIFTDFKQQKDGESTFSARVQKLPDDENKQGKDKLIVVVNIEALSTPMKQVIAPCIGNIKKIIYNMRVE